MTPLQTAAAKFALNAINKFISKEHPASEEIVDLHIAAGKLSDALEAEQAQAVESHEIIKMAESCGMVIAVPAVGGLSAIWHGVSTLALEFFWNKAKESERGLLMQIFTDPENQPSQFGTVTIGHTQAVEPHGWMIDGMSEVMSQGHAQAVQTGHQAMGGTAVAYPIYTHPAPPAAGELKEFKEIFSGLPRATAALGGAIAMLEAKEETLQNNLPLRVAHAANNVLHEEVSILKAALAQQVAVPQPVARVDSWTNGSYSRNYKITWLENVPEGTLLYSAAQGAKP